MEKNNLPRGDLNYISTGDWLNKQQIYTFYAKDVSVKIHEKHNSAYFWE